ncbi:hypothetical protein E7M29_01325 [Campylobacter jejuni]|nr:hypothetical protein [Campylobacter jejuni]
MKKIDFFDFTKILSNHYTVISVKKIRTNKSRPSFKKQIEFKKLYGIPHEFWVNVRSNLINIPKRGRKRKDRE